MGNIFEQNPVDIWLKCPQCEGEVKKNIDAVSFHRALGGRALAFFMCTAEGNYCGNVIAQLDQQKVKVLEQENITLKPIVVELMDKVRLDNGTLDYDDQIDFHVFLESVKPEQMYENLHAK